MEVIQVICLDGVETDGFGQQGRCDNNGVISDKIASYYNLNKLLSASSWSFLSIQISSAESTA